MAETNASGTTTTAYNLDLNVTSITDADGRLRDFEYDNDQRLTAENWMQGGTIVASMNYGYDLDDELTSASDANSAYAFAYDGDGNVTSVDNAGTPNVPHVVLASGYDLLGDRTSLSATINGTADFLNNYSYDTDERLTMVQQQDVNGGNIVSPKEIDYAYNSIGEVTGAADYNFIGVGPRTDVLTGAYSYDGGARLTGIAYTSDVGATTIDTLGWGYDAANNVTSFTSIDGEADYGYDPTNQLTSATYTTAPGGHQPANESFSFDTNGNRTMAGYSTGSDNLLTSDGTFNYQHDANGNTTVRTRISGAYASDHQTTFTWDYRNRLTDVEYYDNNDVLTKHVHYSYDVFDNLIGEQDDDTGSGSYDHQEFYVVGAFPSTPVAGQPPGEAVQPLLQFDGGEALTQRYLVAPNPAGIYAVLAQGAVSSLTQGDVVTWMADDKLGTPRDEVDNSGAIANHSVFSSFGEDAFDSNPSIAHWAAFAGGHLSAATGFENEDERWLDLADGDWLSQDPTGFAAGDLNTARYAGNSPTNAIDPRGLAALMGGMKPEDYASWMEAQRLGQAAPTPTIFQSLVNWVGNEANTASLMISHPVATVQGAASGATDGVAMWVNAFTWHQITPLNNYVNNTIDANGGAYGMANAAAHMSAWALQAAGGLYGASYMGLSYLGTVPIQYAPMQLGIEYTTWGVGLGGAASYPLGGTATPPPPPPGPSLQPVTLTLPDGWDAPPPPVWTPSPNWPTGPRPDGLPPVPPPLGPGPRITPPPWWPPAGYGEGGPLGPS